MPQGRRSPIPIPRTRPGGRLTPAGWRALGAAPDAWVEKFGRDWQVVSGPDARDALKILAGELAAEEQKVAAPT